jgi:hypothetical protein
VRNHQPESRLHYGRGVAGNRAECPFLCRFSDAGMVGLSTRIAGAALSFHQ